MEPQKKTALMEFTLMAKAFIFNEQRLAKLIPMMGTPDGSVQAVQAVVGAIEQKKPVPPDCAPLLGMNVYMLLVDKAQEITGDKPDEQIVLQVIKMIFEAAKRSHVEQAEAPIEQDPMQQQGAAPPADPAMSGGIIGQGMGV